MEFLKQKLDRIWVGILLGLVGTVLGFVLFGLGFAAYNDTSFRYFFYEVFLGQGFGTTDFQSRIITFSMVLDIVLFFVVVRKDWFNMGKGLMVVLVLSVPVVAWLY